MYTRIISMCAFLLIFAPKLDAFATRSTSCVGRCDDYVDNSMPCQCNSHCTQFNDCCNDYQAVCLGSSNSCQGRCDDYLDSSKPCQCNTQCQSFGDCCPDYSQLCQGNGGGDNGGGGNCDSLTATSEFFWSNDINGLSSSDYSIDMGTKVSDGNTVDRSPNPLFTSVDQNAYNKVTYQHFIALLDNYNPYIGSTDFQSTSEKAEVDQLYNSLRATTIFDKLVEVLLCTGEVSSEADFKAKFYNMWFDAYGRSSSSSTQDSSGFEHVFVGEVARNGQYISGFHSWIMFYEEEKAGRMDYLGYVRNVASSNSQAPAIVGSNFMWMPGQSSVALPKALGSFFLGTSPEFEMALYTLCAIRHTGSICTVSLGGSSYRIQTWDVNHKSGIQIASAYPAI